MDADAGAASSDTAGGAPVVVVVVPAGGSAGVAFEEIAEDIVSGKENHFNVLKGNCLR